MSDAITYSGVGVDYDAMDPFKLMAQEAGRSTAGNISHLNAGEFKEFEPSRGESAYLIEAAKSYIAQVEEGLGTKNLVADAMHQLTGHSYYESIAQDTVAMIVNDMVTMGALPLSVAMHLAVGSSDWFKDRQRCIDLVNGWKMACDMALCVWGGGETPTLNGIIVPGTAMLGGSAVGLVKPKERLIRGNIQHGDRIVFFGSSGIHANGLTLARKIAESLPDGYLTRMPDGVTFGEALLAPTNIYVQIMKDLMDAGIDIHYAVNITGHGWRKLMRANGNFTYVVEELPSTPTVFKFIQKHGPLDDREAYGNLNMGAGFAIFVPETEVGKIFDVMGHADHLYGFFVNDVGHIESSEGKKVMIVPKKLEYLGSTLAVR